MDLTGNDDALERYRDALLGWPEAGVTESWVYEYYLISNDVVMLPALFPSAIGRQIRVLKQLGAGGLMSQINNPPSRNWGCTPS